jgi:hypothetical protein
MIAVMFACGHREPVEDGAVPQCGTCGERRVSRVDAPKPVIRGTASGPLVQE